MNFHDYAIGPEPPKNGNYFVTAFHILKFDEYPNLYGLTLEDDDKNQVKALIFTTENDDISALVSPSIKRNIIFRRECLRFVTCNVVENLSTIATLHTTKTMDIESTLYSTEKTFLKATAVFADIIPGDYVTNQIVGVVGIRYEASSRARWVKLTIIDKNRNVEVCRLFDPDGRVDINSYIGRYVKIGKLLRKEKYGFTAFGSISLFGDELLERSAEVYICKAYLQEIQHKLPESLQKFIRDNSLWNTLEVQPTGLVSDIGFHLVRIARAFKLAFAAIDCFKDINKENLLFGVVYSQLYTVFPETLEDRLTRGQMSIAVLFSYKGHRNESLIELTDIYTEKPNESDEKRVLRNIYRTVDADLC